MKLERTWGTTAIRQKTTWVLIHALPEPSPAIVNAARKNVV